MLVSYSWLQSYFKTKLPKPEKLAELLTAHIFEVESLEKAGDDFVLDVKVLPDRAHYCLSHRGIAREIGAIIDEEISLPKYKSEFKAVPNTSLNFVVEDRELCARYIGRVIDGVSIKKTPEWISVRLTVLGQRSINPIVDITNYILLDIGQPLHAFDADKVKGNIAVRRAMSGESITLLDGKEIKLTPDTLLIADDEGPLVVAGIKGGKRAEVTENTKRILLESASFSSSYVRRASTILGVRSDSSKRFENGLSPYWTLIGMNEATALIAELSTNTMISEITDSAPVSDGAKLISVKIHDINSILGVEFSAKEIYSVLERLGLNPKNETNTVIIEAPIWREDIADTADVAEEVGRIAGYEKIKGKTLNAGEESQEIDKINYFSEKIRDFLAGEGFSEVLTTSFRKTGSFEVIKSLASDKNFLRENLTENIKDALSTNLLNAPILGLSEIKLFEIGNLYPKTGEQTSLCVGITKPKNAKGDKVNDSIRNVRDGLVKFLGAPIITACTVDDSGGIILLSEKPIGEINASDGILEIRLEEIVKILPDPKSWDVKSTLSEKKYSPISPYPFIVRDVAVYVNPSDSFDNLIDIIKKLEKGNKLPNLKEIPRKPFDEFLNNKLNKKSFAFRLIFQSFEKTLTDAEVNEVMEDVYSEMKKNEGWVIR